MPSARRAVILTLLSAGALAAQTGPTKNEEDGRDPNRPRLSPALDLLPAGSTMRGVRIPRYDKNKKRAALLRAGLLEVRSEDHVSGDNIEVRVFSKTGSESIRVHMGAAEFYRSSGILEAKEVLTVAGDGIHARGVGGIFLLDIRQGFVEGPVTTSFVRPPKKTDATKEANPKNTDHLLSQPPPSLAEAEEIPELIEPLPLTPEELASLDALLIPHSDVVLADRAPTRELVTRSEQLSQAAEVGLRSFANRVEHPEILARTRPGDEMEPPPRSGPPLKAGIEVHCEGGMYVDGEKGQIAYLRNIQVFEPRFRMTCTNTLKVFFQKKEGEDGKMFEGADDFSDLKTIIASGSVTVVRDDPEGKRKPIIATAETAIFDVSTGDIVLRGGSPTIRQGESFLRAEDPDLYLRFYANGSVFAEKGRWTTSGNLADLRKEKKPKGGEKPAANNEAVAKEQTALDKKKAPEPIVVTCEGGLYFDAKSGQIVYLENVAVTDPRFRMNCAAELKIVLARKPSRDHDHDRDRDQDKPQPEGPDAFGDVQTIVARGKVEVIRTDPAGKREPISASGEAAAYDLRSGEVFLRGGTPVVRQGANSLRAGSPDLYLRFYANGSLFAQKGRWTTKGDLANLRKKPGEKAKPQRIIQVTSEGGLYFDASKGQVVYLGDIKVIEPRFRMNCSRELVIHLAKRPDADEKELEGPDAFADVKVIVAQGRVVVIRKDPRGKKDPVVASADTATYDAKSGDVVLRGGYPSLRQGASSLRAQEPGLYLRFYADGRFHTNRGKWITDPDLKALQKKNE